ncbi:MAG: AI-2E family transporter, partial [Clostridia bacterium]|nr:AI-2E family transporter [Clostridia bacterium]
LNEKKDFVKGSKKIVYATFKPETSNLIVDIGRVGYRVFGKYMLGSVIDSLVVGIICFIFNLIAGIPYSALIAALVGITNIIPFFGPFIGAIPSAIIIFIISPIKALIFIIFIFILQQIEGNIIAPKILGNVTGVSEFWVTFALLFFGAMFGFIGLILGVPMLAVIAYVIHRLTDKRAAKKGYPVDTEYYLEVHSYNIDEDRFEMIDHEAEKREEMEERVKPRNSGIAEFFSKLFKKIKNVFKHEK